MFTKFLLSILFALLLFLAPPVLAGDPPQLSSPSDGSTVSSSKLEWQTPSYTLYAGNNFRVQVDDDSSFSSLNKDYYTDNNYYSPTLTEGVWYWRVKAKDVDGMWSDWSSVWSFTLSSTSSSPSPSPSDDPSPTPSSTPTPQPISTSQSSSFLISDIPSQIDSDQSFFVTINLSLPNNPNTQFYLKGAFKKADSSNYFGYTKVSGSWVKNGSSYSSQYIITTNTEGNWSGNLEVKGDSEDSGFEGTGDYIFKVGRYSLSGSGPNWSNELSIKINGFANSDDSVSQGSTQSTKKVSPSPSSISKSNQSGNTSSRSYAGSSISKATSVASVAAASIEPSPTPEVEIKAEKEINYMPIIGGLLVLSGFASLIFIYLRKKKPNETTNNSL